MVHVGHESDRRASFGIRPNATVTSDNVTELVPFGVYAFQLRQDTEYEVRRLVFKKGRGELRSEAFQNFQRAMLKFIHTTTPLFI
jgi:hypothetical protein